MFQFYNTLTRQKEEFKSLHAGHARIYTCGPTVYWFAHIGNWRSYIFSDVLRRALEQNGFNVTQVINITDVGHLVGDGDEGEDKMIVAMQREGKSAYDIARFYEAAFMADREKLNILSATVYPRATEHIAEQIELVKKLEENGFTYKTTDGIYFDTSKLPEYGRLSGQKAEEKQGGARVELGKKKNATDFALWKFSPADSKREMEWESPWGVGFPGWHLECSAMSKKYLGVPFDIHTGGEDHVPVHHENEIAQTMGADGVLEANVWMHNAFLMFDGGKMSKSLGNIYTLVQLEEKEIEPLAFRLFCLGAQYRAKLNFTFEAAQAAQNALNKLRETVRDWDEPTSDICEEYRKRFSEAIEDDLNTPQALAVMWEMIGDSSCCSTAVKAATLLEFDKIFGLDLGKYIGKKVETPDAVLVLLKQREVARENKDWGEADRLRDEIATLGFVVEDSPQGQKIKSVLK
ncbi:MAG: cysteine--tRNA ligase [Patescibacteria group bacterium]|jgi:cysteinyl-tRNA synthetase